MSVEVEKIIIVIGKKKVELSPDEAKELKSILEEMYGAQNVTVISPITYPTIIERIIERPRPWIYWQPVWTTTSGSSAKFETGTLTLNAASYSA